MWAVLGLGNPGARYAHTRHNVGFMVVEALAGQHGAAWRRQHPTYWAAALSPAAVVAKPTTYVNRSGGAARALLEQLELPATSLLVVVDDVYLPFGRLRLRPGGSAGGHNGLLSIESVLHSRDFPRLRLGVGGPASAVPLPDHVLGEFEASEQAALPDLVARAAAAVEAVLRLGVDAARSSVNAPPAPPGGDAAS